METFCFVCFMVAVIEAAVISLLAAAFGDRTAQRDAAIAKLRNIRAALCADEEEG